MAEDSEDNDWVKNLEYGAAVLGVVIMIPILSRVPRTRGKNILYHLIFLACSLLSVFLFPESMKDIFFSKFGVLIIGTLLPIYESIVAVCSVGEEDDTAWLQFWVTSASFSYATEFMDEITHILPFSGDHWYEFEFLVTLWLVLPFTDGAAVIHDQFTAKYIAPGAKKLSSKVEGWIGLLMTVVNTSYIYIVWFTFMSLPEEARRFVVVAVGTIYPIAASTVAISTQTGIDSGIDDTYWLTYWCCFSILFIMMDYLENFVGHIRGFYSICLVCTVYLFLPMF